MADERGCGGFGFGGCEWLIWIIIIFVIIWLVCPGFFGGFCF